MEENKQETNLQNISNLITTFDSKSYMANIKSNVIEGNVNPLAAFTVLKRMAKVSEELLKDTEIKKLANDEADKHLSGSQKTFTLHGATISKAATYTWYDFDGCGHTVYDELKKIKLEVEERMKLMEEELKLLIVPESKQHTLGVGMDTKSIIIERIPTLTWLDTEDQITVQAPVKHQTIGLKFMKI